MTAMICRSSAAPVTTVLCHELYRFESVWQAGGLTVRTSQVRNSTRREFTAPQLPTPVVLRNNGELALALHFSGEPLRRALEDDPVRLAELVVLGIERVGLSAVLDAQDRDTEFNLKDLAGTLTEDDSRSRVWSDRRSQLCVDLASKLSFHIEGGRVTIDRRFALRLTARGDA